MALAPAALRLIALLAACQLQGAHGKGMTSMFKDMFCAQVKIDMLCKGSAATAGAPVTVTCTGSSCCPKSTCYSNMVPNFKCKSSRGATKCVGGNIVGFKKGVCECKSGVCSASGDCSGTASSFPRLYDDATPSVEATPIEEEDFTAAFAVTGLLSVALVATFASLALRGVRRVARRAAAGQAADGGEAGLMGSAAGLE